MRGCRLGTRGFSSEHVSVAARPWQYTKLNFLESDLAQSRVHPDEAKHAASLHQDSRSSDTALAEFA